MASQGVETTTVEYVLNEAAKFFGIDDLSACCYRPTIPARAKPYNPNRFRLPPSKDSLRGLQSVPEDEATAPSVPPPQVIEELPVSNTERDEDEEDSFSMSSSTAPFRSYALLPDNLDLDDISIETLAQVHEAFVAQSRNLDLSIFAEATFYALCYMGSDGALQPMVGEDSLSRVTNAMKSFRKMRPVDMRKQAVLLANDCGVTW